MEHRRGTRQFASWRAGVKLTFQGLGTARMARTIYRQAAQNIYPYSLPAGFG